MPTTTDRTPAEWAQFCAEKVMGWKRDPHDSFVLVKSEGSRIVLDPWRAQIWGWKPWSPWHNLTDAREVLGRLLEIRSEEEFHIHRWLGASEVTIGDDTYGCGGISAASPGPHEGPAICLLAERVLGEL